MDFASRGDGGRVSEEPETSVVRYRYDSWLFPRAGLVFAWTLTTEATNPLDRVAGAGSVGRRTTTPARARPPERVLSWCLRRFGSAASHDDHLSLVTAMTHSIGYICLRYIVSGREKLVSLG